MFLDGVFGNLKEFMNDYREWHAFVEGFCETFCFWRAKHKLSGKLLKDLKGEHHYYVFGRVVGFIALVLLGLLVVKILRRKKMKVDLQVNDKKYLKGISRAIPAIIGRTYKIASWEFTYWGFSEIHKWRWHKSHIDLGALSVYGFRYNHWFWRIIALIIKPLRWYYNTKFVRPAHPIGLEVN